MRIATMRSRYSAVTHMPELDPEAIRANDAGVAFADERRYAEAAPFYEQALTLAPGWYAPHLNLGIARKHTGDWARSLAASIRAHELDAERAGSGALWNAGVAATALGDWSRARWAWTKVGIPLPAGEGPLELNYGLTPIRVSCKANPEVVWCHRIDPARARIESIPTPESGRRHGDMLLHDGAPTGKRRYRDQVLSVFDELALLEPSPFHTWRIDLVAPSPSDVEELFRAVAEGTEAALEDWTGSLEMLCAKCSEGLPHEHGEGARREVAWKAERMVGVATRDERVFAVIEKWVKAGGGRGTSEAECLLRCWSSRSPIA